MEEHLKTCRGDEDEDKMKATVQMLRDANACECDVAIFEDVWPNGVEISQASATEAAELELDITWFAIHCLPEAGREVYCQAMAVPARVYDGAVKRELGIYYQARAVAQNITMDWPLVRDKAQCAYTEAVDSARAAYNQARVEALVLAVRTRG